MFSAEQSLTVKENAEASPPVLVPVLRKLLKSELSFSLHLKDSRIIVHRNSIRVGVWLVAFLSKSFLVLF